MMYMGWADSKKNVKDRVSDALEYYFKKFGYPPSIVETSLSEEPLEGMNIVVKRIRLPKGVIYVGEIDEQKWLDRG